MNMKKVFYVLAAAASLALAAPTFANAETVVIKHRDGWHHRHHDNGWHRGWEHRHSDRGWHRGWDRGWDRHHHHGDRTVIIKRSHRDY